MVIVAFDTAICVRYFLSDAVRALDWDSVAIVTDRTSRTDRACGSPRSRDHSLAAVARVMVSQLMSADAAQAMDRIEPSFLHESKIVIRSRFSVIRRIRVDRTRQDS
jgi:hypothetical protein